MNKANHLIQKYQKISVPVRASLWFTVCGILQKGISLISAPIFTRLLTTEQYGVFSVYNSWYDIIAIFATLNLFYGAYNNAMTKYSDDRPTITSTMQGLTTTLTVSLLIIYTCAHNFFNGLLGLSSLYVYAMFAELLFLPAFNFWAASERYDYHYRKLVVTTLIISLGSPILGVIAVLNTSYKAEARVLTFVFVQVCAGLVFYINNLYKGKKFYSKKYWKYALVLNVPLIPHYLSSTILNQADRIMINNMIGTGEAAIYSVAYSVASLMTIVTTAIKNTYTPFMYKALKNKNYVSVKKTANLLTVLVAVFTMITILLGPEIIFIFASKDYHNAIWVIPPVACAVFFKFMYPMFSTVEFYYEKTGMILVSSCVGAVINIVLNLIYINIYGYYAAGYTTLVCYILYSLCHFVAQRRIFRKEKLQEKKDLFDNKVMLFVSIILLLFMFGVIFLYKTFIPRYLLCLLFVGVLIIKRKQILNEIRSLKK